MRVLVVSFLIAVISGQQTCGLPDTYPCPLEKTFPRDNIYRTYIVKGMKKSLHRMKIVSCFLVTIQGDSNLPLEDDRNWQVFNDLNGYNDSSDMRDYTMRYDSNGAGVIITFDLPFAANTFMSRSSNHVSSLFIRQRNDCFQASLMQNLEKPALVEWLGLDQSFITSALDVQITTPNNCDNVEQPCASLNLSCEEISSSGRMECSSPCDSTTLVETCGTHAVSELTNGKIVFFEFRLVRKRQIR